MTSRRKRLSRIRRHFGPAALVVVLSIVAGGLGTRGTDILIAQSSGGNLCSVAQAAGTARYVRAGATGAGTGLNWTDATTTLPATLTRGFTYCVADGAYGSYTFDDAQSGTSTITIRKATVADHGTSTGWADTFGDGQASWTRWFVDTAWYVFDGATRNSDWTSGYGFRVGPVGGVDGDRAIELFHGGVSTADNVTFRYIELQGNGLDNQTFDEAIYSPSGNDNVMLSRMYIHDTGAAPILTGGTSGWTLEYSVVARNSSSPVVHAEGWACSDDDNVIVRFNRFEDIEGTGMLVCLNRGSGVSTVSNWEIYGNVFMYTAGNPYRRNDGLGDGAIAVINQQVAANWKIYNNSFINIDFGLSSRIRIGGDGQTGNSNVQVFNNFWWGSDIADHTLNGCTNCSAQSNRYDRTTSGSESNKETNATASTAVFVDYVAGNFHLASPTLAGTALAAPYNVDLDGLPRGADGTWDRGALEFSLLPAKPSNLRITTQ